MPDLKIRIKRQDPGKGSEPRWDEFTVPFEGAFTVLEALFYIQEHLDGSLSFRYCCRASVCGSCACYINGAYRLACQTNVNHLKPGVVTVEPLPHLTVYKDLVVDLDDFFAKYEYIKPWLILKSPEPERDPTVAQGPQEVGYAHRLHLVRLLLLELSLGVGRGKLPGPGRAAEGPPVRG